MAETTTANAGGVRARVRAELTAEIKASATRQLIEEGASGLSLRAIARELGMASSAIYRYFASRDELLTALIIDAYEAVGDAVETAGATADPGDHRGRFTAVCRSIRTWAKANPNEYALIYGSPVPGYRAPEDTIDPAIRVPVALISPVVGAWTEAGGGEPVEPSELDATVAELLEFVDHRVPATVLARSIEVWGEVFGLISLELFGHFKNSLTDPDGFFEHALDAMSERVFGDI